MSYDHLARAEFQRGKSDEGAMTVYLNNMTLACLVVKLLAILSLFVPTAYPQTCGLCLASRGIANCLDQGVSSSSCIRILNPDVGRVREVFVPRCSQKIEPAYLQTVTRSMGKRCHASK